MGERVIKSIVGRIYDRPSVVEGVTYPDWEISAHVGLQVLGVGPAVTDIRLTNDGCGPMGYYDQIKVWADDKLLMQCPAWSDTIYYAEGAANG